MFFEPVYSGPDDLSIAFNWDSSCKKYDFNDRQDFTIYLLLDDNDYCHVYDPDSIRIDIHVDLPPNTPPLISTDLGSDSVSMEILGHLLFNVFGKDEDNDKINLYALTYEFDLMESGFNIQDTSGTGEITQSFSWDLGCYTIDPGLKNEFQIDLVIEDEDKCKIRNADTLSLKFTALLPQNNSPYIDIGGSPDNNFEINAGDEIHLDITGVDIDNDSIKLFLIDDTGLLIETNASFEAVSGISKITTSFDWLTDCRFLGDNYSDRLFQYQLVIEDNKCLVPMSDTVELHILLKNREVNYTDIFIPNIFTPNNDRFNDYFTVPELPEDNCRNRFLSVAIYNRYGREVFYSNNRDFRWFGQNVKNGVYYYLIKFTETDYKGYLQVLY
jgi:gliding motility-associated-like protein